MSIKYYSATELLQRAKSRMVSLENQRTAQKKIASLIAMHLNKLQALDRGANPRELYSGSAFLLGHTGNGKTFIIKSLAEVCGLHFATIDCASITMAGYKGMNLGDALAAIVSRDKDFFDGGILNIDEADKAFYTGNSHHDAYNVMQEFLKLIEGGEYSFKTDGSARTVNLDRTLILLSGACSGIGEILEQRYNGSPVSGFLAGSSTRVDVEDYGALVTLDDLIRYGMMPELASRINTVIHIPKIDAAGYKRLLMDSAKTSALNRFRNQFGMRGVALDITLPAANRIAALCVERNVGARSIHAILCEQLTDAYDTVDDDDTYNGVLLTANGEGFLRTKLIKGKRLPLPDFIGVAYDGENFSIASEITGESNINRFCDDICSYASLQTASHEPLLYYFLQTACQYLSRNVKPSEMCFESLLKLAKATVSQYGKTGKPPFEVICGDYLETLAQSISKAEEELKKPEDLSANVRKNRSQFASKEYGRYYLFNHFFSAFCREAKRYSDVSEILLNALTTAGKCYLHFKQANQKESS